MDGQGIDVILTLASTPMYARTVGADTQFLHVEEEANPLQRKALTSKLTLTHIIIIIVSILRHMA